MTTYTTRTLAAKLLTDEVVDANPKAATREVRKFLRADTVAKGGKVGIDTPGKGGRYTLDLKVADVKAMAKRFAAWQVAEEKAKAERAALKAAQAASPIEVADATDEDPTDEAPEATDEDLDDDASDEVAGPSDEEIAAMLSDEDDE